MGAELSSLSAMPAAPCRPARARSAEARPARTLSRGRRRRRAHPEGRDPHDPSEDDGPRAGREPWRRHPDADARVAEAVHECMTLDLARCYTDLGEVRTGRGSGRVVWRHTNREPLPLDLAAMAGVAREPRAAPLPALRAPRCRARPLAIDRTLFTMAFGRDVDDESYPQSTCLDRRTGAVVWLCEDDEDACGIAAMPAEDKGRAERRGVHNCAGREVRVMFWSWPVTAVPDRACHRRMAHRCRYFPVVVRTNCHFVLDWVELRRLEAPRQQGGVVGEFKPGAGGRTRPVEDDARMRAGSDGQGGRGEMRTHCASTGPGPDKACATAPPCARPRASPDRR